MTMTRRERFCLTMKHKPVDRPLRDIYGCPQTMIDAPETIERIKEILGIEGDRKGDGYVDERILEYFDTDTRMTGGFPIPKSPHTKYGEGYYYNEWGIGYRDVGGRYEIFHNPLKDKSFDEIKSYSYPKAEDIDDKIWSEYAAHAKRLYEETEYIVVGQHPVLGVFELGCWMFGFDDFLYRMAGEPQVVKWFFDKILEYQKKVIEKYYTAIGDYIHVTTSGDDFGTQRGTFMSVDMFREQIAPYYRERIDATKKLTKAYYQHHTCGSVYSLIPTLIECGVDILNPIQPGTLNMEPERLKRDFGDKICFWGGIDTQELLVHGSVWDVKAEVNRLIDIFSGNGCYILSPAHCIQSDVPAENVIAIFEAAKAR